MRVHHKLAKDPATPPPTACLPAAVAAVPGTAAAAVPGSAVAAVPGSAVAAVPGSAVGAVPGNAIGFDLRLRALVLRRPG